jgi:sec-independent protein translocase protein TatA
MPNVGPLEIAIVLVIVLIIFGPKRLPELGKSMGEGIRGFRGAMTGEKDEDSDSVENKQQELQAVNQQDTAGTQEKPTAEKPVETEVITENKG